MPRLEVLRGNNAAAHGARLARVQVIATYPITPQTDIVEDLAGFVANGELDAKFINVESEHSALSVCHGAQISGVRAFTATASMGLGYMFEGLTFIHGFRLPLVMVVANRAVGAPMGGIGPDYSDVMSARDFGFIQLFVENNQEALDTVLQAYRIAEDERVHLPIMVNIDGYYISFSSEPVSIPDQEEVDRFLPPYQPKVILDPDRPMTMYCHEVWAVNKEHENDHAMANALTVIEEVGQEFDEIFGRSYGVVEEYRCEDARMVFVTIGSMTGTAREAIDLLREEGIPVGLLKLRTFRPFPTEHIRRLASKVEVMVVIDRNVSHGAAGGSGIIATEVRAALFGITKQPDVISWVVGLGGQDINVEMFYSFTKKIKSRYDWEGKKVVQAEIKPEKNTDCNEWHLPPINFIPGIAPKDADQRLLYPGSSSCAGCAANLIWRTTVETLGRDTVYVMPPSCMTVLNMVGWPGYTPVKVPFYHCTFASTAASCSGVKGAMEMRGRKDTLVVGFAGDGGTADIGFQALSAAASRGDSIIHICYDNEAYMNTGVQKSSTTPLGAKTATTPVGTEMRGNPRLRKDMPRLMADHGVPYVATASAGYIRDYRKKLLKAADIVRQNRGLAYLHVQAPCPTGWRFPDEKSIKVARLAVETGVWPLYEIEDGVFKNSRKLGENSPVDQYTMMQGRFSHLSPEQNKEIQEFADRGKMLLDCWEKGSTGK